MLAAVAVFGIAVGCKNCSSCSNTAVVGSGANHALPTTAVASSSSDSSVGVKQASASAPSLLPTPFPKAKFT